MPLFQKWFRREPLRAGHGICSSNEGISEHPKLLGSPMTLPPFKADLAHKSKFRCFSLPSYLSGVVVFLRGGGKRATTTNKKGPQCSFHTLCLYRKQITLRENTFSAKLLARELFSHFVILAKHCFIVYFCVSQFLFYFQRACSHN